MIAQSFWVTYPVRRVQQTTATGCWAAAAAMVLGRNRPVSAPRGVLVPDSIGIDYAAWNISRFAQAYGFVAHHPQTWTVEGLYELLCLHGPLWVGGWFGTAGHVSVLAGMWGDGGNEDTTLLIIDSQKTLPQPIEVTYREAISKFPEFSEWILHARTSSYERNPVGLR